MWEARHDLNRCKDPRSSASGFDGTFLPQRCEDHEQYAQDADQDWKTAMLNKNYPGYYSDLDSWADQIEVVESLIKISKDEFEYDIETGSPGGAG